jgi:hypothetical protein
MYCINHQALRTVSLFCQGNKDPVKDTEAAPPDEAIIQSLVWIMRFLGVFPLKTVAVHINDPTQDTPVIHTWRSVRQREKWLNPLHLAFRQQKHVTHRPTLHRSACESQRLAQFNKLIAPEPRSHLFCYGFQ